MTETLARAVVPAAEERARLKEGVHIERSSRRVRTYFAGKLIADSEQVLLVAVRVHQVGARRPGLRRQLAQRAHVAARAAPALDLVHGHLDAGRAKHGYLLMIDEVQTGMHRTGPFLYSETLGIRPDLLIVRISGRAARSASIGQLPP